ncbi:hypothetical protein CIPAW_15G056300 [Carya illinoinensis]|uniref:Uncharacterized protein n=1 Tax=Carya illinoinensis TaxID=32201 RepID=A0A8T1NCJ3_CARIL|nr:hypothetical protein CIPAW_15G056300 [Carya illinoinensis]
MHNSCKLLLEERSQNVSTKNKVWTTMAKRKQEHGNYQQLRQVNHFNSKFQTLGPFSHFAQMILITSLPSNSHQ